jgi:CO/xanthine dehydrogenase FAD-binding subunit
VAPVPQRASAVEALLVGTTLDAATLEEAAAAARTLVSEEMQDIHATAEYRRELVADLTRRLLPLAWSRCSQARSGPA